MPATVSEAESTPSSYRCPECGAAVKRVLRTANDKRRWDADDWQRYRCRSDRCSWQGLLRATHRRRRESEAAGVGAALARVGRATLLLLMAAGLAWGGIVALQQMIGF